MKQQAEAPDNPPQAAGFAAMAKDFLKAASEFNRSRSKVQAELDGVTASIEALEREKEDLLTSPASREDFVEALCVEVDRRAEWGVAAIRKVVEHDTKRIASNARITSRFAGQSPHLWEHQLRPTAEAGALSADDLQWADVRAVIDREEGATIRAWLFNAIVSVESDAKLALHQPKFSGELLALCFGEALKSGLRRAFEQIEWPHAGARSSAERMARLAAIDAELQSLRAQETDLLEVLGIAPDGAAVAGG